MVDREEPEMFVVVPPAKGTFRFANDVIVEYVGKEWIVTSSQPAVEGEIAQLGFGSGESMVLFDVTVLESRPTIVDNFVRHRLRLAIPGSPTTGTPGKSTGEKLQRCWATAVLMRDHEVRLLAFSTLGCAVESDSNIRPRTCGQLRVSLAGVDFVDSVEIVVRRP